MPLNSHLRKKLGFSIVFRNCKDHHRTLVYFLNLELFQQFQGTRQPFTVNKTSLLCIFFVLCGKDIDRINFNLHNIWIYLINPQTHFHVKLEVEPIVPEL